MYYILFLLFGQQLFYVQLDDGNHMADTSLCGSSCGKQFLTSLPADEYCII